MITIAIPTGKQFEASLGLLARAGVSRIAPERFGRRLLVEDGGVRVVLVRPADVAAYVEHGAADLGIVGKDQLWEAAGGAYELVDLGFGACKLVIAVPEDSQLRGPQTWPPTLRVATKYRRATIAYMDRLGQSVELVDLHGSVELAPLVGLVDAISDLTETGTSLRENRLRVVAEVASTTMRLIANQASLKTRAGLGDAVRSIREVAGAD